MKVVLPSFICALTAVFSADVSSSMVNTATPSTPQARAMPTYDTSCDSSVPVTSRKVVWVFVEQFWFEFVPVFHCLQGRLAAQG